MNYYPFHIGEPWQAKLDIAIRLRNEATTATQKSRCNYLIRKIRLKAAQEKGTHSEAEWLGLVSAFQCRCVMCGSEMRACDVHKDHIIPIYQGGSDGIENIQPLCGPCNSSKGPDTFNWAEYRMVNGFGRGIE